MTLSTMTRWLDSRNNELFQINSQPILFEVQLVGKRRNNAEIVALAPAARQSGFAVVRSDCLEVARVNSCIAQCDDCHYN